MGNSFHNTTRLPAIFVNLLLDMKRQKRFMKSKIEPLLNLVKSNNDGTLSSKDFLKINNYYGLAVPAILGEAFCVLHGKTMTENERWASTSQGIITGLFDDFFDDLKLPEVQIVSMVDAPENVVAHSSNEKLFLDFYIMALKKATHPELIKDQLMRVHHAQVASVEQENPDIGRSRVWEITCLKGGDSVLFYRTAFDQHLAAGEREALFQLGSLMQLENDIFDVYKDSQAGISTLPTTLSGVNELRKLYNEQTELLIVFCKEMDYPDKQVVRFLDKVMPVIARGFVCLDRFKQLEESNKGLFDIVSFSRKQLICDMEKPGNILNTIRYQIKQYY